MNYLVFDCVLNKTFITLVKNDEFINKTIESDSENYHSVYLISEIKNILEKNSLSLKDLDFIGVDVGPASFTGIRVGLCVAKIIASEARLISLPLKSKTSTSNLFFIFSNRARLLGVIATIGKNSSCIFLNKLNTPGFTFITCLKILFLTSRK